MHTPVLLEEVLAHISQTPLKSLEFFLEGTFGRGGHLEEVFKKHPHIKAVALDCDKEAVCFGEEKFSEKIKNKELFIFHENFVNWPRLKETINESLGTSFFDIILLDLGVSTPQLKTKKRGFSFYEEGPLDMRMNQNEELTAAHIVNKWSEDELNELFQKKGDIEKPERVVSEIVRTRKNQPYENTRQLARLIEKIQGWRRTHHHPATQFFLALRLEVNQELENIEKVLPEFLTSLKEKGRLLVITFHSLEDRIVKQTFQKMKNEKKGELVNKKVIKPSWDEVKKNPKSRSAKLRVFQKARQTL